MKHKSKNLELSQLEIIDRSKKLNPNNELYWKSRGFKAKPENWQERISE